MKGIRSLPLQLWLRILISLTFFLGGAFMVFWAQGFRFDFTDRSIVSTGVVSLSTVPSEAGVVIDSELVGESSDVLLGMPLGLVNICFHKTGFSPFCDKVLVDSESVAQMQNIHLLPQNLLIKDWGKASDFLWDPLERGFLQIFPILSSILIYDQGNISFLDSLQSEVFLTHTGNLLLPLISDQQVFYSEVSPTYSSLLPDSSGILYIQEKSLFLRWAKESKQLLLAELQGPIEDAFFLHNSESIIVATATEIFLIQRAGGELIHLFQKDSSFPLRYFPLSNTLFFQVDDRIVSFTFS